MNSVAQTNYDSEFCGSLPIHVINVIQPYGALVAIEKKSGSIIQASENISTIFGTHVRKVVGSPVSAYVGGVLVPGGLKGNTPHVISIHGRKYLAIFHELPEYSIIEINLESEEEALDSRFIDTYQEFRDIINSIEGEKEMGRILRTVARELKNKSGFDKVMIYRFDENWNGHVVAEEMEPGMESYLGFTFPASDIPKQARDLYLKNAYRYIPDVNYEPVKLYPVINPETNTFLDISDCNVRGVSSVHLEYLRNMNVSASMSTRIIRDGRLWGLIACHHRTARPMNYRMCAIFELLSTVLSSKISALENAEKLSNDNIQASIYTSIVEETYRSGNLISALLAEKGSVLDLFHATGAAIFYRDQLHRKGNVPAQHDLEDIVLWLHSRRYGTVYCTDSLGREYEYARELSDVASGMMSIPIDAENDEYLLLFRPEVVRVINWGGDPASRIRFEEDMKTYHPRFSFKLWREEVKGVALPWRSEEIRMAENLGDFINGFLRGTPVSR